MLRLSVQDEKKNLRNVLRVRRAVLFDSKPEAGLQLRNFFEAACGSFKGGMVATYVARGSEIDPSALGELFVEKGFSLCLPCVEEKDAPLVFRAYRKGDPLRSGSLGGIPEPFSSSVAVDPDIFLLPLLGFDCQGGRIGQGGGFYDRTLAALRARKKIRAIGLAFAGQEIKKVPVLSHDQFLDLVLTEEGVIDPDALISF